MADLPQLNQESSCIKAADWQMLVFDCFFMKQMLSHRLKLFTWKGQYGGRSLATVKKGNQ